MSFPDNNKLYAVIEGTWPAAVKQALGPWAVRLDQSNSSRVNAATAEQPVQDADIAIAQSAMIEGGQRPLFMIREGDAQLDALLAARGYVIKDPVNMYAVSVGDVVQPLVAERTFAAWPPLAVQAEIWARGGIGQGRIAIMDRARDPKTTLLGRVDDTPAGTAYVAIAGDCAMIHALEVAATHRRRGLARDLTIAAAHWAQAQGAAYLTLVTTQENEAANALYASLGMTHVGQYHYRILPE
ncbi:Acetyltransferase (GNAT) family protein [Yoonia tamlensis]|uniref:Acetyltransferase (GNAT) family protein n=1 Tax=Yoonia tamlensis TaxID=390270 RepID=A0A1I6I042_9RHOB|nr:GNAT family N-acetyltransferase [Yoonia tamlensis]SFR60029.1 Acetyltransferase (GNAT) family protein [Yoonia tamlensis]